MEEIYFEHAEFLPLFKIAGIFTFLLIGAIILKYAARMKRNRGARYPLFPGKTRFFFGAILVFSATVAAVTEPFKKEFSFKTVYGTAEIFFAVDMSFSGRAKDITPTRLEKVKEEIIKTVGARIFKKNDYVSLIKFGTTASTLLFPTKELWRLVNKTDELEFVKPVTDETVWFTHYVPLLDLISTILEEEDKYLSTKIKGYIPPPRLLFIFSDGSNQDEPDVLLESVRTLQKKRVKIYPIGVGTASGVSLFRTLDGYVPGKDFPEEYVEDWRDQWTRLEMRTLDELARETGGTSFRLDQSDKSATEFIKERIDENRTPAKTAFIEKTTAQKPLWRHFAVTALITAIIFIIIL